MGLLRRPLLLIPLVLVLVFGAAVLAAYTLLPGVVRSQGQAWVATNLPGKVLTMGEIAFDPWQLLLDIEGLAIADVKAPDRPLVTVKDLKVDLSITTLWQLSPRLDALVVDTPVVDAILRRDGSINLAELMPVDDGSPMPQVWIGDLSVGKGTIYFTDDRRAVSQRKTLAPVTFALQDFATTAAKNGGASFDATSEAGEALAWRGEVSMAPLASTGRFTIGKLQLATIGRFAGDLIPARLEGGVIDIAGQYRFLVPPAPAKPGAAVPPFSFDAEITTLALKDAAITASSGDRLAIGALTVAPTQYAYGSKGFAVGAVAVDRIAVVRPSGERATIAGVRVAATRYDLKAGTAAIGTAAVTGISVTGRGAGAATIALAGISVAPSEILLPPQLAKIGLITATGLRAAARVGADNSISVPGLYPLAAIPPAPAAPPSAWQTRLAGFALDDAAVRLDVARAAPLPGMKVDLAPLTIKLGALTGAMDAPLRIDLATRINGGARLAVAGTASPAAMTADLGIDLAGLPLTQIAALAPPTRVVVRGGSLDVKGRLTVANGRAGPAPGFAGNVGVSRLDLAQDDGNPLLSWQQLDLVGIRYAAVPAKLAIARIAFVSPVSHVVITREARLNLATVAGIEPAPAEPAAAPDTAKVTPIVADGAATAVLTPAVANGDATPPDAPPLDSTARRAAARAARKAPKTQIKVAAPVSNAASAIAASVPTTIGEVTVRGGTVAFEDNSIEPRFAARIQGFTGAVTGLSTAPGSQARFNLKGYVVDRFSPVTITGRANPFAYDANTDLTAKFSNIELPVFNPYSGRFAGYSIAKGKLSTTIHYRIVNRGLKADHNVVVDQLTWGEATDSKQKVSLPVRLATSLLKDKDGVINLDLPVEGTLDDPQFKIWPVVWKVVGNLLTKIITAPFALIGSLFGGGEKAQFVDFDAGSAVLPPDADKGLKAIAKGLAEKQEVNLDIPAGAGIKEDAEAMTTRAIETAVLAGKKGPVAADYAGFDSGKKLDKLKSLYKAKFGKGPKFPDGSVTEAGMLAGGEAKAAANASQVKWLETELRAKYAPTDADLAALGQARADAVKGALLGDGTIEPTRVFVATDKTVKAKDGKVEMELAVK